MQIEYLPLFARQYKKLSLVIKLKAELKETIFRNNPFDSSLHTHKLTGKLVGYYAFSVTNSYRILFTFSPDRKMAWFHQVETHDIYE